MAYDFDWVDAFSDVPFGGNRCAVFHDAASIRAETAMQIVRETSLVECTFTGPSEVADLKVRYFLASREIPFAGHPTLATVAALAARGEMPEGGIRLETGAGIVPVTRDADGFFEMIQAPPDFGPAPDPALVAAAVGLSPEDLLHPPQYVSTGLPFCITLLRSRAALERARLDRAALQALCAAQGYGGDDMMEPFLVALEGFSARGRTAARLLMAPPSPPEDPFTGSATGAMAAYLWHHGLIPQTPFIAEQGHGLGRPGFARVRPVEDEHDLRVAVAGPAKRLMSGQIHI